MWFKNIFHRPNNNAHSQEQPLFDEHFLRRLERLSIQAQRSLRGHPSSGEHPSRHNLPSSIFSDHRPYTYGDDLRYVDWNAYARHNLMLLKLGEAEQNVDIHLLLDVSRSMAWGEPPKMRVAQQLAGAISYLSLAHSDRVMVVPFGETVLKPFGPAQGKGRVMDMLRYIEAIPVQKQTGLSTILQDHARRYQRGGILILCSDLLAPEGLAEGLQKLAPPRWQVLIIHMIDPREINPELEGTLELQDSETDQRMAITFDERSLHAYQQSVFAWQERIATICARRGATYARIFTDLPLEQKIVPYLRLRRLLV